MERIRGQSRRTAKIERAAHMLKERPSNLRTSCSFHPSVLVGGGPNEIKAQVRGQNRHGPGFGSLWRKNASPWPSPDFPSAGK